MSDKPNEFVVGLLVCPTDDTVVLVRKNRPAWQAGLLNGVGGHVQHGETPAQAMVREYNEEAGALVNEWELMITMTFLGTTIWFYRAHADAATLAQAHTATDEPIAVYPIADLLAPGAPIIPNLRWLLPLAAYTADRYRPTTIEASVRETLHGNSNEK